MAGINLSNIVDFTEHGTAWPDPKYIRSGQLITIHRHM